jgi:WhiB family transcriptional regulator, redox-sensing transcriptional regulator
MKARQTSTVRAQAPGERQNWRERAACRDGDPELFYGIPESGPGQDPLPWEWSALETCWNCPVTAECLAEAMKSPAQHQWGVAGGMTAGQRKAALSKRTQAPADASDTVVNISDLPVDVDLRTVQALIDGHQAPGVGAGERRWAAIALHRGDWPITAIAAHLGMAYSTVRDWVTRPPALRSVS